MDYFLAELKTEMGMVPDVKLTIELHDTYSDISEALNASEAHLHYRSPKAQTIPGTIYMCSVCIV